MDEFAKWTKKNQELVAVGSTAIAAGYLGYRLGKRPCPTLSPQEIGEDFPVGLLAGGLFFGGVGLLVGRYFADQFEGA